MDASNILAGKDAEKDSDNQLGITNMHSQINTNKSSSDTQMTLRTPKCLTEVQAKPLVKQLLKGIKYLHLRGVVHRDLNPNNVFLHRAPQQWHQPIVNIINSSSELPQDNNQFSGPQTMVDFISQSADPAHVSPTTPLLGTDSITQRRQDISSNLQSVTS